MVLMTPERIAARDLLFATYQDLQVKSQNYEEYGREQRMQFTAQAQALEGQIQVFAILANAEKKLAEIAPFWDLYQGLKPDAVKLVAAGVDEVLDFMLQVADNVTKYDELRRAIARSTRATYEAYLEVGFEPEQAFACTLRTMEVFDEAVKNSFRNAKIEKK